MAEWALTVDAHVELCGQLGRVLVLGGLGQGVAPRLPPIAPGVDAGHDVHHSEGEGDERDENDRHDYVGDCLGH